MSWLNVAVALPAPRSVPPDVATRVPNVSLHDPGFVGL